MIGQGSPRVPEDIASNLSEIANTHEGTRADEGKNHISEDEKQNRTEASKPLAKEVEARHPDDVDGLDNIGHLAGFRVYFTSEDGEKGK